MPSPMILKSCCSPGRQTAVRWRLWIWRRGGKIPLHIQDALKAPLVTKHAYNAAFEWYCLNRAGYDTPLPQWKCTMAHSLYCGYPAGLAATGEAIGLPQDKRKLNTGRALIRYFCVPCKPTKRNGGRTWNLPHHEQIGRASCRERV